MVPTNNINATKTPAIVLIPVLEALRKPDDPEEFAVGAGGEVVVGEAVLDEGPTVTCGLVVVGGGTEVIVIWVGAAEVVELLAPLVVGPPPVLDATVDRGRLAFWPGNVSLGNAIPRIAH